MQILTEFASFKRAVANSQLAARHFKSPLRASTQVIHETFGNVLRAAPTQSLTVEQIILVVWLMSVAGDLVLC